MKRSIFILLGWTILLTVANAASFDCSKASTKVEKMICNSDSISMLDSKLNNEYSKALAQACDANQVRKIQRGWLKSRDTSQDEKGLTWMYENQLKWFFSKDTPPIVKNSVINSALGKYKFQVDRDGCVQYLSYPPQAYVITISDPTGKQVQKMSVKSSSPQDWLLSIIDLDGDGYKD